MWLKYYDKEIRTYPLHHNTRYPTPKDADGVIRKLFRHFKLGHLKVYYDVENGGGVATYWGIRLPKKDIKLSTICHEIGHHVARQKTKQWNHNHKTWMKMKQVFRYAERFIKGGKNEMSQV